MPVLRHPSFKPSYPCISSIRAYFASLPRPVRDDELIMVGDRVFTDTVIANRMARYEHVSRRLTMETTPSVEKFSKELDASEAAKPLASARVRVGPLAILTTAVWERDSPVLRRMEMQLMRGVERWVVGEGQGPARDWTDVHYGMFFREFAMPAVLRREEPSFMKKLLRRWRGD